MEYFWQCFIARMKNLLFCQWQNLVGIYSMDIFKGIFMLMGHLCFFCVFICIWEKAFIMVGIER